MVAFTYNLYVFNYEVVSEINKLSDFGLNTYKCMPYGI